MTPLVPNTPRVNPISAADPASKIAYTFTDTGSLHTAIKTYGFIPLRKDGSPFVTVYLEEYDGYVLDGAPINVWMQGYWFEGQREAMEPYWTSGKVQRPAANILDAGSQPMPEAIRLQTEVYQTAKANQNMFFGMDSGTLLAVGAGLAAIFLISRR